MHVSLECARPVCLRGKDESCWPLHAFESREMSPRSRWWGARNDQSAVLVCKGWTGTLGFDDCIFGRRAGVEHIHNLWSLVWDSRRRGPGGSLAALPSTTTTTTISLELASRLGGMWRREWMVRHLWAAELSVVLKEAALHTHTHTSHKWTQDPRPDGHWFGLTAPQHQPPSLLSSMAVARKIKTLLTVNILVFVGIILFSVYCRIQDRSEELIQIGRISDQRLRARNGKVTNLVDRQSILQRLERLEDVVYNQLNGKDAGLNAVCFSM